MKKAIHTLLWITLWLSFIALQAWSLVSANLTSSEQTLIDGFIQRRAQSHSASETSSKAILIQDRITYTLQVSTPNDFTVDVLQYIDNALDTYVLTSPVGTVTPSTPVVTTPSVSTTSPQQPSTSTQDLSIRSIIQEYDDSREIVLLAWEQRQVVAQFELNARLEPFVLEEIILKSSESNIQNTISQVHLYDEAGYKLWSDRADSTWVFEFKNLNYTLEQGSTKVYAVMDTMIVWYNGNGQDDLVALTIQVIGGEARGEFSSTKYSIARSNTSKQITIQSVLIESLEFLSQAQWVRVNTQLTNGTNTLAILEIQTADSNNQEINSPRDLDVMLDSIQIQVSDNTVDKSATNSLVLERLNRNGEKIMWTVIWEDVTFMFGEDIAGLIENWETAYFRIVAENVQLNPSQWESVRIEITTASEAIMYRSSDPRSSVFDKNANENLFIQNTSLSD